MSSRSSSVNAVGIVEIMSAISELNHKVDDILKGRTRYVPAPRPCGPDALIDVLLERIDDDLEREMVSPCDCRISCKEAFTDFLQRSANLIKEERVEERKITDMRNELQRLRATAPYRKCAQCFNEVSDLFSRHVRIIRSQNNYVSDTNLRELIRKMDEELVVRDIVDPLSNPYRLEIMKLLLDSSRSYSELSAKTGLKGGNLLFHLQKLTSTGMISQNVERGDYAVTEKGDKVMKYLTLVTLDIGAVKWA